MSIRSKGRRGQTMVEYIIIVVLVAITLLVLFGKLSKATGKKVAGATSALDEEVGGEAAGLAGEEPADKLKQLDESGNFN
ncbi:MAG: hypothetical protein GX571_02575 [Lentisphaerae bacterium]|jgi:Flp pilus assembly pilin Flp|nr:hypothetical protein [Lentisphaerota bacterium]